MHFSWSHIRSSAALGMDVAYTIANTANVSPSTSVLYCWYMFMTASAVAVRSHTESCVALHRVVVISSHVWHLLHRATLPFDHVESAQSRTSAPPLHSFPGGHGIQDSPSSASVVFSGQRVHSLPTKPESHVQLAASVHPPAHHEWIRHCEHMAAPLCAHVSGGHGSM